MSLEKVDGAVLGHANKVVVGVEETTIVTDGTQAKEIAARIEGLKVELAAAVAKDLIFDTEKIGERIASLGGGIASINVGGATEVELKDRKLRYEDAVNAVRSGMECGVVPGGGAALLGCRDIRDAVKAQCATEDEAAGVDLVFNALSSPMRQIAHNAGEDEPGFIVKECLGKAWGCVAAALRCAVPAALSPYAAAGAAGAAGGGGAAALTNQPRRYGWNAKTGVFEDLLESGVVDPAKVSINAIQNSVSIAALVLSTEATVLQAVKKRGISDDNKAAMDAQIAGGADMGVTGSGMPPPGFGAGGF